MYHLSCIIHHLTPIMNHLSSNTHHASSLICHLSFTIYPQASCLMIMTMVMVMIMIMIMILILIMIMTRIMVSYHHHEASRTVRGSVGGCSMDMWCPHGIGREIWDRVVRKLVDPDPSPLKGRSPVTG